MSKDYFKIKNNRNSRAKKSCLLGSIFAHAVLFLVMGGYLDQHPIQKERQKELEITHVELLELNSVKLPDKSVNRNDPLLDTIKRKQFVKRMPSLNKVKLTHLTGINNPDKTAARKRLQPNIKISRYQPAINNKQISIVPVLANHKPFEPTKVLTAYTLSSRQPKITLARDIKALPTFENTENDSTPGDELLNYENSIKELIAANKVYPLIARKKGLEGMVLVSFLILRNGQLKDVRLVAPSKYRILDQAAIKTIKKAGPFMPLPERTNKDELWMKVALAFKLN